MSATTQQKKLIHILRKALGHDQATYEDILFLKFRKTSSKDLTVKEAGLLIAEWKNKAEKTGAWKKIEKVSGRQKFEELGIRQGFATPKQLRMLEALWMSHSRTKTEKSFNSFLERIAKVSHLRFLRRPDVQKVKKAIEQISEK